MNYVCENRLSNDENITIKIQGSPIFDYLHSEIPETFFVELDFSLESFPFKFPQNSIFKNLKIIFNYTFLEKKFLTKSIFQIENEGLYSRNIIFENFILKNLTFIQNSPILFKWKQKRTPTCESINFTAHKEDIFQNSLENFQEFSRIF